MKFTKRILAVLLTLTLALGLALPTMAAVNWNQFMFTKRQQDITIKYGDSFTLSVEVNVPAGVDVEYQWYHVPSGEVLIENATTNELRLGPESSIYPQNERLGGAFARYRCRVTANEKDALGNVISKKDLDNTVIVRTERTLSGKLYDLFIAPFGYAFGSAVGIISMSYGLLLPVSPIVFLVGLIFGFIQGFRGLF